MRLAHNVISVMTRHFTFASQVVSCVLLYMCRQILVLSGRFSEVADPRSPSPAVAFLV